MKLRHWVCVAAAGASLFACGDDEPATQADATDDVADTGGKGDVGEADGGEDAVDPDASEPPDGAGDGGTTGDAGPDGGPVPITFERPEWFPAAGDEADDAVLVEGVEAPVRVVYDDRGIPHIYAESELDLAFAQGYVTARDRLFQMHTLKSAASGRLAEFSGQSALAGDVLLRTLRLRAVAEQMAADAQVNDPELWDRMVAFAAGVNLHLEAVNAGKAPKPTEAALFGITFEPWTPVDTMTIVRLQTWDLSFGGYLNEEDLLYYAKDLKTRFDGTPLEGVEADVVNFTPPAQVPVIDSALAGSGPKTVDVTALLEQPFFAGLTKQHLDKVRVNAEKMRQIPHHFARGPEFGSNNWIVSGQHTASGRPLVANDTHLALRNPAVFYQVHLSTVPAGGDFEVAGVNFAGAPGIVLGTNGHGAWGGTVFFSDVTDFYVETFSADGKTVLFDGAQVPVTTREEVFEVSLFGGATCESVVTGWLNDMDPVIEPLGTKGCRLTVTVTDVPHHGPVVPWSWGEDAGGNKTALAWKWTGFEPTADLSAVWRLNKARSVQDFKDALDLFAVGAQNWVWGDKDGHIAWYPSHRLPKRAHIEAGNFDYPPFFPMPGDGSAEWDGFLDRALIPQAVDPDKGYVITANSDPIGVSFDNDPFNDGPYIGYVWDAGYREARITERMDALVAQGGITPEAMKAVQADTESPLGKLMTPFLLQAIDAARSGADSQAAAHLNAQIDIAEPFLAGWTYDAASGVGAPATTPQAKDAVATTIFNFFLTRLVANTLGNKQIHVPDRLRVGVLHRMLTAPEQMATWDEAHQQSGLWDDPATEDVVETRDAILVKSLAEGLALASNPAKTGPGGGGFGDAPMADWRWGALHTVKLRHNVTPAFDIPAPSLLPGGYPRPGDNFVVDAAHPGMADTNFTYAHGPAIRNVYGMTDVPQVHAVIPGGQSERAQSPHYSDEMVKWAENLAPEIPWTVSDVLQKRQRVLDLVPQSALTP